MKYSPFDYVNLFAIKSSFFDIYSHSNFLWVSVWLYKFIHYFIFNLPALLYFKWFSYREYRVELITIFILRVYVIWFMRLEELYLIFVFGLFLVLSVVHRSLAPSLLSSGSCEYFLVSYFIYYACICNFFLGFLWLCLILWMHCARSVGQESTCNTGDPSLIPASGRSAREGIGYAHQYSWASFVAQLVKNQPAVWEYLGSIPGLERTPR